MGVDDGPGGTRTCARVCVCVRVSDLGSLVADEGGPGVAGSQSLREVGRGTFVVAVSFPADSGPDPCRNCPSS